MLTYLLVCPLVFLAGFVDAIAGGGGLISLPAYLLAGLPVHQAIATNKCGSAMGTSVATWRFARSGYIPWKLALPCVAWALIGSAAGAELALLVADRAFRFLMLAILPLTAFYVLRGRALHDSQVQENCVSRRALLVSQVCALVIGVYDGFYGPGTGTFLLLLLTGLARLPLRQSNGITKVINLSTNVAALTVFLLHGQVLLPLGLVAGCFSVAGNYIGSRFFSAKGSRIVKPLILVVLVIFFVKVAGELAGLF